MPGYGISHEITHFTAIAARRESVLVNPPPVGTPPLFVHETKRRLPIL